MALVLRRLAVPGAYLAAAIFALHPVHVESVAWITEQKNTLSAVFYLGAMLVYLRFDQTRKTSLYCGALGLFVLGLLSKTVTATLPAALLVIFWWQRGRLSWRRDVLPLVPFLRAGRGGRAVHGLGGTQADRGRGRGVRAYDGGALPAGRPGDLVLPGQAVLARGVDFHLSPLAGQPGGLVAISVSGGGVAVVGRRCGRCGGGGAGRWRRLLFFVGTLFPVLGFCNVYPFLYSFVADHFQYLASLGVITLASAGVALLLGRWGLWRSAGRLRGVFGVCWRHWRA